MNYWRINFQPTTLVNHNRAMVTNTYSRWKVGAGTFVLWFLAVACVVFWGLKLSASQGLLGAPALAPTPTVVDTQALVRLLGGSPVGTTMAAAPTRYSLVGVLAGTRSGHGAALIEIDGKPAKPYRVGAQVTDGLVLQSVGRREAHLGAAMDGVPSMTLQIPLKTASASPVGTGISPSMPAAPAVQSPMIPQGVTPGLELPGIPNAPVNPVQGQ